MNKKKLILVAFALLLVATAVFTYKKWRHYFVREEVPKLVFLQSDSLYRISYDDVYIDEIGGEIRIQNLYLRPDTTYKNSKDSSLPGELLEVFVPELHITGIKTDIALLNKEIVASKIALREPVVGMYYHRMASEKKKREKLKTDPLYKVILRNLQRIAVDSIMITGASYHRLDWITRDTLLTGTDVNVRLYHLNINDSSGSDTSSILYAQQVSLTLNRLHIKDRKGFYDYRFDSIAVHSADSSLFIKNAFVIPLYSEAAFMKAWKWQTDRFNFDFSGIRFFNANLQGLTDGNLVADSLRISYAMFKIFRDRNYPRKYDTKVGNYPHQLLQKAPVDIALKQVTVQNGYVEYKEKNPKTDSSGRIRFHNTSAVLRNVSNRKADISNNNICRIDFNSRFLDRIPFTARLQLYLSGDDGKFTAHGSMGPANVTVLNELVRPLGLASLEKGRLNKMRFDLRGNDHSGYGNIQLLYQDLKIKLLKKDDKNNEYDTKGLPSFLANIKIINDNPKNNKPPRTAAITQERDIYRSFFSLLWKSIFKGIKEIVGMS